MARGLARQRFVGALLGLAAALAAPPAARAQSVALTAEPSYTNTDSSVTDQGGVTRESNAWRVQQVYRGSLDEPILPLLRLNVGGFYDWGLGTSRSGGLATDTDNRFWGVNARLTGGNPTIGYGLGYTRTQRSTESTTAGTVTTSPTLVTDGATFTTSWKPLDLPELFLQAGRTRNFDEDRRLADLTNDTAQLSAKYSPSRPVDLQYGVRVDHPVEHLQGTDSTIVSQGARVTYTDSFRERRLPVYVSYGASRVTSDTHVTGTGGTVATIRTPTAGLSAVETFPDTPERITLPQNPALVDGSLTGSAGIDLGFARSTAGDVRNRHLGAQLADAVTAVNTLYVWVDKQLPSDVLASMTAAGAFSAWRSDDNVTWTQVPIIAPVVFGLFENRFEITIPQTQARYLKIVTRPLARSITTDERFASILVTEVQLLLVVPAETARGHSSTSGGQLSASAKYIIDPAISLAYDSSLTLTHSFDAESPRYALVNGIGAAPRLSTIVGSAARAEWSHSDFGIGQEDQLRWGGTLSADPLPSLGSSLGYTGLWRHGRSGITYSNGVSGAVRADVYAGISVSGTVTYALGHAETGQATDSLSATASTALIPHRTLVLNGAYGYSRSGRTGGGLPAATSTGQHIDGSAAWSPLRVLYASAGISRILTDQASVTTGSFAAGISPFPGGNLQLRFQYAENFDTSSNLRTRAYGPSLRWTIRPTLYADASYSAQKSTSDAEDSKSRVFFARLFWAVR